MWILVTVASYLLFAIVALVDKYLLAGPLLSPKTYVFYVGVLGVGVVAVLAIFGFVTIPEFSIALLGLFAGMMRAITLLLLFIGLRTFEASRIIPAFGGGLPIFSFLLTTLFTAERQILLPSNFFAFGLLLAGTVIITITRDRSLTLKSLAYAVGAAFFGAISFFLSKIVYEAEPFLSALSWLLLGAFFVSLVFLVSTKVRSEVLGLFLQQKKKKGPSSKKFPVWIFLAALIAGGGAALLQNIAIWLVPVGFLPFINAMSGIEYLFLFIFAVILARRFPSKFHEEISRNILIQKFFAISCVILGFVLLAL